VWRQNTGTTVVYDLMSLPIAYAFAKVYAEFGIAWTAALAVPLLGIRQLYKINWQLEKVNQELLELMVAAIEARDPYTSGHSRRVSRSARIIARAIGLSSRDIDRVGIAALLHDVGKIHEVYAPILRKPGSLTAEEQAIMQTHPIKSAELVQNVSQLKDVVAAIRHHHENWDGTGYPDGRAGEEIPLAARIVMIADTIDAMTTDRPYRMALGAEDVRRELERLQGIQFDPQICQTLLSSPLYHHLFAGSSTAPTPARGILSSAVLRHRRAAGAR
jgi:putative nucleotidyltransferase with HDIG domain